MTGRSIVVGAQELSASLVANDSTKAGMGCLSLEDFNVKSEQELLGRYADYIHAIQMVFVRISTCFSPNHT
jgi:hypothetical protein